MKNVPPILLVPVQLQTRRYTTPVPPHYHRMWELSVFESGEFKNVIDGQEHMICAGDVLLLGEPHMHSLDFISGPNAYWDIYVPDQEMRVICNLISPDFYEKIATKQTLVHFKLSSTRLQHLLRDLRELSNYELSIFTKEFANSGKSITSSFLVHYLLGVYHNRQSMENITTPDWLQNLLYNLQSPDFFCQKVSDIIDSTGYSHSQFSRAFKDYTGIALIDYLVSKRLEYATELLQKTDYSILNISSTIGYDSLSFFIRLFKKQYGITPLQYRKQRTAVLLKK